MPAADSVFRMMFIGLSESLWEPFDCKLAMSWLRVSVVALDVALSGVAEEACM